MNASQRIAELERQLAEVSRVDLVRVNGRACEVVGKTFVRRQSFVHKKNDTLETAIPLIIVKERE